MATPRKKAPQKDTAAEEIDLSAFDMSAIAPLDVVSVEPISSSQKPLSKKERDIFDDTLPGSEDSLSSDERSPDDDDEPVSKNEFDDEFDDPFDLDDDDGEDTKKEK